MKIPQIFRNTENGGRAKDFQRQSLPRSLLTFHFELSFQWRAQWSHCALLCNRQRQQFLFVSDKVNTHQWLFVIVCLLSTIFTYLRGRRTRITTRSTFQNSSLDAIPYNGDVFVNAYRFRYRACAYLLWFLFWRHLRGFPSLAKGIPTRLLNWLAFKQSKPTFPVSSIALPFPGLSSIIKLTCLQAV